MNDVLPMLIGAALVSTGVLASALADRIRGLLATPVAAREVRESREAWVRREAAEAAESAGPCAKRSVGTPAQGVVAIHATATGSEDVVAALVGAGYKKAVATKAVAACIAHEQASLELWTAAALRRCAMGGAS